MRGIWWFMKSQDFNAFMAKFDERMQKYISPKSDWTPQDEVIYIPTDPFRIPLDEAHDLRFKALKYAFEHHYNNSTSYNRFCREKRIKPDDIKKPLDLIKIPLIPESSFKEYPEGKDFAIWLGNLYVGKLPDVVIKKAKPSLDDVISDFNEAGLSITYSSGTSGRHTFIPRDQVTLRRALYAYAKSIVTMAYNSGDFDAISYFLGPNPKKTNLWTGKVGAALYDVLNECKIAIEREVTPKIIRLAMGGARNLREKVESAILLALGRRSAKKIIADFVDWLKELEGSGNSMVIASNTTLLSVMLLKLEEEDMRFDFSGRGLVITGGGWKKSEDKRIPALEFRQKIKTYLGIPEESCLEIYGMVENNAVTSTCPEGHYFHIPYAQLYPMILDKNLEPVGYGKVGRFAFLEATASSYPAFIITGDTAKMLEHCPICDRPGPVFAPEITRLRGEEIRGCAEEIRRIFVSDHSTKRQ